MTLHRGAGRRESPGSRWETFKTWYRWGYWLDTPQGVVVLLSMPLCWLAALAAFLLPAATRPVWLSSEPVFYLLTPLLSFLYFVRFGQLASQQFSSSVLTAAVVLATTGMPFYFPYLRSAA